MAAEEAKEPAVATVVVQVGKAMAGVVGERDEPRRQEPTNKDNSLAP